MAVEVCERPADDHVASRDRITGSQAAPDPRQREEIKTENEQITIVKNSFFFVYRRLAETLLKREATCEVCNRNGQTIDILGVQLEL